jgi:hypothetical protein
MFHEWITINICYYKLEPHWHEFPYLASPLCYFVYYMQLGLFNNLLLHD